MAKKKSDRRSKTFSQAIGLDNIINDKTNFIFGFVLLCIGIVLIIAFISYFSSGSADQSLVDDLRPNEIFNSGKEFQNACGSLGALLSDFFINKCFGIPAFFIPVFIFMWGLKCMGAYPKLNLWKWFFCLALVMVWMSVTFAKFITPLMSDSIFNPGGNHGLFICQWFEGLIGSPGLIAVLIIVALAFVTYLTSETITFVRKLMNPIGYITNKVQFTVSGNKNEEQETIASESDDSEKEEETEQQPNVIDLDIVNNSTKDAIEAPKAVQPLKDDEKDGSIGLEIGETKKDERADGKDVSGATEMTPINPREPFTNWHFPSVDLLKKYPSDDMTTFVRNDELQLKKDQIIKVLNDFDVQIRSIRATVGPTITLYEITPAPGIRISKIKNLEDDIALSLAAKGIRIIAPMPGKGTIGIEVPNEHANIVSMWSILNSKKFAESKMELPIALGKTITNEVFMVDLAKIPHLLVAGATGQGKSVGLNAIITSLLYKKHPNELKIVLVDPKKVEFSVYSPIASHFMAALEENEEEPIITDVQKVVKTLKGLCVLMDERYDMLKNAGVRNIKEYNKKFLNHHLNPEEGHAFMPYIVVIIDEFGDLIMTAGKEIEMPITRIAQLARAVGIHMIIATQRPTTKIITGTIKANFPGRIAFRVGSRIDSQVILDRVGAQQLVGRGDMLYLNGSEPTRVQCAFVDTPEVEAISKFIAEQPGPVEPMVIPEPAVEDGQGGEGGSIDSQNLDPLFEQAARMVVVTQQGSTSKIQRHFAIGYNRAGRLMDQLQKAGIVGEAQGSKPREVLISDENTLNALLSQLNN
ncbi:MAG: DNA translocase FtsK 4TM domain-containing protein [Prevotella sp.]|jgi:S-DNA-T family DNA segregation ATPase FtsK/SpoIIIE|nr:DNA translocase FtsK 4TM domain-containing protein [Prevotella sp.]